MKFLLLSVAAMASLCGLTASADDNSPTDPVEHYLKLTVEQIDDVEDARFASEDAGKPMNLVEFSNAYSAAMAAARSDRQQQDIFAHHHKALECMSDRRAPGDENLSIFQVRGRCKSELSDLAYSIREDDRKLAAQPASPLPRYADSDAPGTPENVAAPQRQLVPPQLPQTRQAQSDTPDAPPTP